jgi:hypothetical protein
MAKDIYKNKQTKSNNHAIDFFLKYFDLLFFEDNAF